MNQIPPSSQENSTIDHFRYDDDIVKKFIIATLFWGVAAFGVGLLIAFQLANWKLNFKVPWLTFGRIRALHTNAAIFAFAGNAIFAGIYHSSQRLLKARLFSDFLGRLHFWGWQLIILGAAITLPLGFSVGKEYAELEWPFDIAIAVVWVAFAVNFFGTIFKRRERHLYVAIWFYIATIITVAVLHIVNSIEIPVSFLKSYPVYAGVQDALVQWWYGHNAVAFFLTTPFLGLMYYYLPKAASRPVYSYRLSIIHFWSLVFIYIWAGPHHLLYSALPDWAQTLGMIFSLMLWAPSWGGMINGLLTLRGAWNKVRTDPILKFLAAAVTFYGMATFEGPLLSIKSINSLAHFTDWIIGHVHSGTLGWNGFMVAGMFYYLVPKVWKTKLYSNRMANIHFWLGTFGILLYMSSMWASGITQGLMLRAVDEGGKLIYPDFVETVVKIIPLYYARAVGGAFYLAGYVLMLVNIWKTVQQSKAETASSTETISASRLGLRTPDEIFNSGDAPHRILEGLPTVFTVLVIASIFVGSVIEIVPTLTAHKYLEENPVVKPYTPLELMGRDLYIREGCYTCHSQMVRPIVSDVLRYGSRSTLEESMYDHPFQWGSKRTGPDLARVGGKYPDLWHYRHMINPRDINQDSIMPSYPWLMTRKSDFSSIHKKMKVMKQIGVPYSDEEIEESEANAKEQAIKIAQELQKQGTPGGMEEKEIVALISYLQRIGKPVTR